MIRIRFHRPTDLPELIPLYQDFFDLHRALLGNPKPLSQEETREIARESISHPQSWLLVAEDEHNKQIIGFARWELREGAFFGRELFVLPKFRAQGIGTQLIVESETQVREMGADSFFISIVPQNRPMLAYAVQRGYDTLNTVELRKELQGERTRRGQVNFLGLDFKIA